MSHHEGLFQWTQRVSTQFPVLSTPQAVVLALWSFGIAVTRSSGVMTVAYFLGLVWGWYGAPGRGRCANGCASGATTRPTSAGPAMLLYPIAEAPAMIRKRNRFTVLNLLRSHGVLSKSELVRRADLTAPIITNILDMLVEEGLVRGAEEMDSSRPVDVQRGRPSSLYALNTDDCAAIGLQIA